MSHSPAIADAELLAQSWQLALRAEPLMRAALNGWIADLLGSGYAPATARSRLLAVGRFAAWLAEEGEIDADPFLGIKAPKLHQLVLAPPLSRCFGTARTKP